MLPTDLFTDLSIETVDTVKGVFIPLSSISGLTEPECHPTTGDGREVLRAMLTQAHENLETLPARPTSVDYNYIEAVLSETQKRQDFAFSFNVVVPSSAYQMAD